MLIRTFTGGSFGQNTYLVHDEDSRSAIAVDPGAGATRLVEAVRADGLSLQAVVLTHAHLDHVEGVHVVRDFLPDIPIFIHPADLQLYRALPQQAAMFGLHADAQPEPTDQLVPDQDVTFDGVTFQVRFTPGHAPGHVILIAPDDGFAIVGDVVFQGSIGRTDLPGGDFKTLMASIREQVLTLPDDMVLYTGHGPPTTVGAEREGNPFLIPHYGGGLA